MRHAESIGYPVVLKVNSPDILHKTEVDAIRLNLHNSAAVKGAFAEIMRSVEDRCPDAVVRGILVQEMVPPGLELILGVKNDPVFGAMVLCGLGGIHTEILRDFTMRRAPVDRETAAEMLRELRGYKLLEGARGVEAADIDALIRNSRQSLESRRQSGRVDRRTRHQSTDRLVPKAAAASSPTP